MIENSCRRARISVGSRRLGNASGGCSLAGFRRWSRPGSSLGLACLGAIACAAGILHRSAAAGLLLYDGFAHPIGNALAGNGTWSALNTGTAPVVAPGNLVALGVSPPSGDRVTWVSGNIQEAWNQFGATVSTGAVYFSMPFQLSSVPTTTTYSFGLTQSSSAYGATVWLRADGTDGFNIGLDARTTTPTTNYLGTKFLLNETVFLVGAYEFVAGTSNDVARLWVNPPSSTFASGTEPAATLSGTSSSDLSGVVGFLLRGASGSPAGSFDELRIGTSWADVTPVPEPSSIALALATAAALTGFARHRARGSLNRPSRAESTASGDRRRINFRQWRGLGAASAPGRSTHRRP